MGTKQKLPENSCLLVQDRYGVPIVYSDIPAGLDRAKTLLDRPLDKTEKQVFGGLIDGTISELMSGNSEEVRVLRMTKKDEGFIGVFICQMAK
jgi:hypothetical protein